MFTIEQIKAAHSKVKSGADFPQYVKEISQMGVRSYVTYVSDGHTEFSGSEDFKTKSEAKYSPLIIAEKSNKAQFQKDLKEHQQGKSSYLEFCSISAALGVEKWVVNMSDMTCTYYDEAGIEMLVERIPG